MRVLTLPSVLYLLGASNSPSVLTDEEIEWMRRGLQSGNAVPHEYLKEGQRVVITSGALAGLKGILLRRVNNARVVVSLDSIGRGFAVEVDLESVRPLEDRPLTPDGPALPSKFPARSAQSQPEGLCRISSVVSR